MSTPIDSLHAAILNIDAPSASLVEVYGIPPETAYKFGHKAARHAAAELALAYQAELDRLRAELDREHADHAETVEDAATVARENTELRKDAERYRNLRVRNHSMAPVVCNPNSPAIGYTPEGLDAALDALP